MDSRRYNTSKSSWLVNLDHAEARFRLFQYLLRDLIHRHEPHLSVAPGSCESLGWPDTHLNPDLLDFEDAVPFLDSSLLGAIDETASAEPWQRFHEPEERTNNFHYTMTVQILSASQGQGSRGHTGVFTAQSNRSNTGNVRPRHVDENNVHKIANYGNQRYEWEDEAVPRYEEEAEGVAEQHYGGEEREPEDKSEDGRDDTDKETNKENNDNNEERLDNKLFLYKGKQEDG